MAKREPVSKQLTMDQMTITLAIMRAKKESAHAWKCPPCGGPAEPGKLCTD